MTAPEPAPSEDGEGSAPVTLDRLVHAAIGRLTMGISPASVALAWADWGAHLMLAPGKQQQLAEKAVRKSIRLGVHALRSLANDAEPPCIEPLPQDRRFDHEAWQRQPYALIWQSFLLTQQWWHNAMTGVPGVTPQHERVVSFITRQLLDVFAPSNWLPLNPELQEATLSEGGQNLVRGAVNFIEDWERAVAGKPPVGSGQVVPGRDVAVTPGSVIFRNSLIELIQYAPTSEQVQREPLLIVPAWIMKYYVLDLSPHNSLVRYLVEKGFSVFVISWKNPTRDDRDLGLDDYRRLGIEAARKVIREIMPERPVHAVGYCLGGTLLAIAAAALARDGDEGLRTLTLLAAQTDFEESGELSLFIDHSALTFLEDIMWDQGYLDMNQMAGAFQLLRSNDLIWSRMLRTYLLGRRDQMTDLMAWNADATRMPYRMHSEYLRHLYLDNDLSEGRFRVDGRPVALSDIRAPLFLVGTETDHVAPWRSVYKLQLQLDTDISFVLTSGGHNAGIVSEPGHPGRHFRVAHRASADHYVDPDTWCARSQPMEGSWWPAWVEWLRAHSEGEEPAPSFPPQGTGHDPVCDAPGTYVLQH